MFRIKKIAQQLWFFGMELHLHQQKKKEKMYSIKLVTYEVIKIIIMGVLEKF